MGKVEEKKVHQQPKVDHAKKQQDAAKIQQERDAKLKEVDEKKLQGGLNGTEKAEKSQSVESGKDIKVDENIADEVEKLNKQYDGILGELKKEGKTGTKLNTSEIGALADEIDGEKGNLSAKDLKGFKEAAKTADANGDGKLDATEKKGLIDKLKEMLGLSKPEAEEMAAEEPAAAEAAPAEEAPKAEEAKPAESAPAGAEAAKGPEAAKAAEEAKSAIEQQAKQLGIQDGSTGQKHKTPEEVMAALSGQLQQPQQNPTMSANKSSSYSTGEVAGTNQQTQSNPFSKTQQAQPQQQIDSKAIAAYDQGYTEGSNQKGNNGTDTNQNQNFFSQKKDNSYLAA